MNESDFRWVDDPAVHAMHDGFAVVWVDQAQKDIFFQQYGAGGQKRFAAPTRVSTSRDTFSWLPRIVVAPNAPGVVHVLWQEIVFSGGSHGGEIFFARSADGGESFSDAVNLSVSVAGDGKGRLDTHTWDNGSLDLARSPTGELYAVWTEYEGALWFRRSTDDGKSFSAPLRLGGTSTEPARAPSLATGRNSVVHVAWALGESDSSDIRLVTSMDAGRSFGAQRTAWVSAGRSDAPKLALAADGTVHLAYTEWSDTPVNMAHVVYSRLSHGSASFEPPRRISSLEGSKSSAAYPHLALDEKGRIYLLWEHYADGDARATGLGFTHSDDRGKSFRAPSLLTALSDRALGFNGSQQGSLTSKLTVGAAGAIAIVNSTFQPDRRSDVWLLTGRLR